MKPDFDAIVIGAGIIGSCTAYQLAKKGKSVLVLEQFALDNDINSSHGGSRIFRFAHEEAVYMPMAKASLTAWKDLEKETDLELLRQCGFFWAGQPDLIQKRAANLTKNGVPFQVLKGKEIQKKFKHLHFGEKWHALFDPNGGVLLADKCVLAAQRVARNNGAKLQDNEPVLRIESVNDHVDVYTIRARYTAKRLIVTAGPWTKKVLPNLGISMEAQLMGVNYYKVTDHHERFKTENGSPMLLFGDYIDPPVYALPDVDMPGYVKAGVHLGLIVDPDTKVEHPEWMHTIPAKHFGLHVYDLDTSVPAKKVDCFYTVTEDEFFVLDKSPKYSNVFVAGGFSGYGFKFAPVIGEIMARMAVGESIGYDLSHFRINRQIKGKAKI